MNNVLDYKGYRFFQSSFDPDEKGTVLSVSHDFWEQLLLMLVILFFCYDVNYVYKTLAFADLKRKLEVVKRKISKITVCFNEYEQFCPDHNHEFHDEDGGHVDHVENGTHTELHQRKTVGPIT
jgi:hypothetical protein